MSIFGDLQDFFTSNKISRTIKVIVPIFAFLLVIWVVDFMGFTRYAESKHIDRIQMLGVILQDSTLSTHERLDLISLRNSLISRRNITSYLFAKKDIRAGEQAFTGLLDEDVIDITPFMIKTETDTLTLLTHNNADSVPARAAKNDKCGIATSSATNTSKITLDTIIASRYIPYTMKTDRYKPAMVAKSQKSISKSIIRSDFWFFVSSSWWILLGVILVIVAYILDDDNKKNSTRINTFIVAIICFLGLLLALLCNWLFGLVFKSPIAGHWWLTYTIIAILPFSISILWGLLASKKAKATANFN